MTYRDIHGWFTWPGLYRRMAEQVYSRGTIVELGVWRGRSLAFLAQTLKDLGKHDVNVIGIDLFNANGDDAYHLEVSADIQHGETRTLAQQARDNLDNCGLTNVKLIQSDAIAAASLFADASVDFLFVDDMHDPDHVERELWAWLPKLRRPTWIAGDDAGLVMDGVRRVLPNAIWDVGQWVADVL